jgi:hypothetical protein
MERQINLINEWTHPSCRTVKTIRWAVQLCYQLTRVDIPFPLYPLDIPSAERYVADSLVIITTDVREA